MNNSSLQTLPNTSNSLKTRAKYAFSLAKSLVKGHLSLQITDKEMEEIAGSLLYKGEEWLLITENHPLFAQCIRDISEILPLIEEEPHNTFSIFVHASRRYCLISSTNYPAPIYPFVFKHSLTKGTKFYRLIEGKPLRWMSYINPSNFGNTNTNINKINF